MITVKNGTVFIDKGGVEAKVASHRIIIDIPRETDGSEYDTTISFQNRVYTPFGVVDHITTTLSASKIDQAMVTALDASLRWLYTSAEHIDMLEPKKQVEPTSSEG